MPDLIQQAPSIEQAIDNVRVQRLLGILPMKGKATMESIPSRTKNKSIYSCKRYEFFLDAPFEISNRCCNVMKKEPAHRYLKETGRVPITAMMASESRLRTQGWLKTGCNAFESGKQVSNPMAFWTESDVLLYCLINKVKIADCYGEIVKENEVDGQLDFQDIGLFDLGRPQLKTTGYERTGCMWCGFGSHLEKPPGRFERMKETHPKQYDYIMRPEEEHGLGYKWKIDWINEHGNLHIPY